MNCDRNPTAEQRERVKKLLETNAAFGVSLGEWVGVCPGPCVTRFDFQPDPQQSLTGIARYSQDVALQLSVYRLRMVYPQIGSATLGIEVPNPDGWRVPYEEVLGSETFARFDDPLPLALGVGAGDEPVCLGLSRAPHLLIGGQPGSGKTRLLYLLAAGLMQAATPERVRLLLITPQPREFAPLERSRYLWEPVVDDPAAATERLQALWQECQRRCDLLAEQGVRSIDDYTEKTDLPLCRIVALVDEFAPVMAQSRGSFEQTVCKLAQKGRPVGIHLVLTTAELTPANVTGIIKANIPTRIALSTRTPMESRTIMDAVDAACLMLGGDMLLCSGMAKPRRIQAADLDVLQLESIVAQREEELQ